MTVLLQAGLLVVLYLAVIHPLARALSRGFIPIAARRMARGSAAPVRGQDDVSSLNWPGVSAPGPFSGMSCHFAGLALSTSPRIHSAADMRNDAEIGLCLQSIRIPRLFVNAGERAKWPR